MATYPTQTVDDLLSGAGAQYFGQDEYDAGEVLKSRGMSNPFADASNSAASFTTLTGSTRTVRLPNYVRGGDMIRLYFWLRHTIDGNAAYARFCETGVNGTTASVTGAGSATLQLKYSDVAVPDDTWAGVRKTFRIEAYRATAGAVHVTTTRLVGPFRVVAP